MAKWKITRKWIKRLLWLTAFVYFPCWIFAVLQASLVFNLRSLYHAVVDLSFTTGLGFYLPYAFKITHILLALCVVGYVLYLRGNKEENVFMSRGEKIHDAILWMMILGALPFAKDLFLNLQYF